MILNWRKWNRVVHRDFGYLFLGMTIIYALSGIAINHIKDWNPNYVLYTEEIQVPHFDKKPDKQAIKKMLEPFEEADNYKNHYFPNEDYLRVFIKDGTVSVDLITGEGLIEKMNDTVLDENLFKKIEISEVTEDGEKVYKMTLNFDKELIDYLEKNFFR